MMLIMIIFIISVLYKVKSFGAAHVKVSKEQVAERRPLERSDHCDEVAPEGSVQCGGPIQKIGACLDPACACSTASTKAGLSGMAVV
jgi:hypothetical protein